MASYYRTELLAAADSGRHALSIARNKSSCRDASLFHATLVDVAKRATRPLGSLAPGDPSHIAGAGQAPRGAIAGRDGTRPVVRVIDLAANTIVGEVAPGSVNGLALDGAGEVVATIATDRVVFHAVADGRVIAEVPLSTERRFQGAVAWSAAGWVVARCQDKKWSLAVLDAGWAPQEPIALPGDPWGLVAAGAGSIVACGIGKTTACIVDLDARAVVKIKAHTAKDAYAVVTTAIASDGALVVSRGTETATLVAHHRGADAPVTLRALPNTTTTERGVELLTTPAFALCGDTLVTVTAGAPTFEPAPPSTATGSWAKPARKR